MDGARRDGPACVSHCPVCMRARLLGARAARRGALGATALAGLALTHKALSRPALAADDSQRLHSLWDGALDGMVSVPGAAVLGAEAADVLYLAPAASTQAANAEPRRWPAVFGGGGGVFSLTGYNPMGRDAPLRENLEANRALHADLRGLEPPPRALWRSFGFNPAEGWREDGFSVSYAAGDMAEGRRAVLRLARAYRQAAIYEYAVRDGKLLRRVVWCDPEKQRALDASGPWSASRDTQMGHVARPPDSELAQPQRGRLGEGRGGAAAHLRTSDE